MRVDVDVGDAAIDEVAVGGECVVAHGGESEKIIMLEMLVENVM